MKRIIITLLALGAFGGVASADRHHSEHYNGPGRDHRGWSGGVSVHNGGSYNRGYVHTYNRGYYSRPAVRVYAQPRVHIVRRPIYVQRPVIRYRYYDYYQRPALISENYAAMPGYYWVAGQWQWSGYEWIWQPGHYEPDPNYNDGYYDQSYDQPGISGSVYFNSGY